jgi:hypothetical protein
MTRSRQPPPAPVSKSFHVPRSLPRATDVNAQRAALVVAQFGAVRELSIRLAEDEFGDGDDGVAKLVRIRLTDGALIVVVVAKLLECVQCLSVTLLLGQLVRLSLAPLLG